MDTFLQHLNPDRTQFWFGISIAAFSCAEMISSPLYGLVSDWNISLKNILLVCNLVEVVGESSGLTYRPAFSIR